MVEEDFKKEFNLGVDRKRFSMKQRFLHNFEKRKNLRLAVVVGIGTIAIGNVLMLMPGTKYLLQTELKQASATGFLKFAYLSKE